ncbi:MAG: hypothetical protein C0501_23195 [Isosphaera sp.]|nr:hypothetical protein [Isosphaera sp.]
MAAADEGLVVRKGKTNQEGSGRKLGNPLGKNPDTCPVRAVQAWLELSGVAEGPLFRPVNRHGHVSAGRSARRYAGHSLRAGLITQAAMAGVSERAIQDQSGHKSLAVIKRYIRDRPLFRENAAAKVEL